MQLNGKMKYTIEEFKVQAKASTLKVGDRLITEDIAGKAAFEVAEIRKKYIYMVRRYCLPDKYDQTHDDLMDFLNNEYLDTLPQDLKNIMGKREGSRIFVPWFNEVFGEREDCDWADKSKGKQWSLFRKGYGRIRLNGDKHGCSRWYWLASPYVGYSADFCIVGTSGAPDYDGASTSYGVLPCFKINREAVAE
ncbi:MAG: hypothetical protein E7306_03690 [Butyrivibrio sp.]|nr:hypothetical protein [Butyrivibrio sp.]